jgi:ABC-type transport system substrate-binding protein
MRQAVSLAGDREAINDAECGGMGVVDGNWINNDVEYGIEWPKWPHDLAKARATGRGRISQRLQRRLGDPGAELHSRGERIVSQLQAIGIRSKLQVMERGAYLKKLQGGLRVAGRPDYALCDAHRRLMVELVRHAFQVRRFQRQGLLLHQGPRRPVPEIPGIVRSN